MKFAAGFLVAVLFLAGCVRDLSTTEVQSLSAAAPTLLQAYSGNQEIPSSAWPPAIAELDPERVYSTADGIYIARSTRFVEERGVFIARSANFAPAAGSDPSYAAVAPGVFAYTIKG